MKNDEDKKDRTSIGEKIKFCRISLGWKQKMVAHRIGISVPSLSKIEGGTTDVSISRLDQIAQIFGLNLFQLFNVNPFYDKELLNVAQSVLKFDQLQLQLDALQKEVISLHEKLRAIPNSPRSRPKRILFNGNRKPKIH